jgi:hypothetical protein
MKKVDREEHRSDNNTYPKVTFRCLGTILLVYFILYLKAYTFAAYKSKIRSVSVLEKISTENDDTLAIGKKGIGLNFSNDSGYVVKKNGLPFLLSIMMTDTINSFWSHAKENDTIGKYYRNTESGTYFICLIDLSSKFDFETHLLLEIKADGTVIKNERYFHGNYSCCWNNYYEGFYKRNNFFVMTTCGTGSGYCGSQIYIFKEIIPQNSQKSISKSYWSSNGEDKYSLNLSSAIEWKEDCLLVHYTLEKGKLIKKYSKFKVKKSEKFEIQYLLKNGQWEPVELNNINKLGI